MNDPDDYYHGQPRIDQDVELLLENGYIGQYFMRRIPRFHELRHLAGVTLSEYAFYQNKIIRYENHSKLFIFYKTSWVVAHAR